MIRHPIVLALSLATTVPASADDAAIVLGKALSERNCAACHATATEGQSPLLDAPAFRDIAVSYDQEELEDAFNEGVATDHPVMPDWQMTPEQARALSIYIMSLASAGKARS